MVIDVKVLGGNYGYGMCNIGFGVDLIVAVEACCSRGCKYCEVVV